MGTALVCINKMGKNLNVKQVKTSKLVCVGRCGCVTVTKTVLMALMRCQTAAPDSVPRKISGLFNFTFVYP